MNLHLVNEYTSNNLGDASIYETFVQLAAPLAVRSRMPLEDRMRVRGLGAEVSALHDDVHVSVGGDIFNNARPRLITRRFIHNLRQLADCPPERSFLFGQSIPSSCRGLSLWLLSRVLRRLSSVTVRDEQSHARLRALGVPAELCWDIVFGYQPGLHCTEAGRALFDQAGIAPERCVLFSVREFDAMYPHDSARFLDRVADLCQRLLARGHQPTLLIQASAQGADSDAAVATELLRRVPQLAVLSPFAQSGEHHPVDAMFGAIAQAQAVVAVRYHTAVLRLVAGRQPYSLHYSNKGADLAQRLRLPGMALADFDPAAALAGIEASAEVAHDAGPQRRAVRERFAACLNQAAGRAVVRPLAD